jgi:CubicO group peptidase (beta-lactamase class C family)
MKKFALVTLCILVVAGGIAYIIFKPKLDRLGMAATLFTGAEQYENFARIKEMIPTTLLTAASTPYDFPNGEPLTLPDRFNYEDTSYGVLDFLELTDTSALLVIQDGKVRFEEYFLTGGRDVHWISWSLAKSFTSTLVGIAIDEGLIKDVNQPITDYVPELKGSAYDGVAIVDVLEMSSGAAWREDYADPESEVIRMGRIMGIGGSLDDFTASIKRQREPGTYNKYNSGDTQALGMLVTRATGRSLTNYMQEKLWGPLGAESDAYWLIDSHDVEMAFAGLNATARDYAKIGELFRNKGNWFGKQIVSADWVESATHSTKPHLLPGDNPASDLPLGYGYQWWLMDGDEGEYSAIGVYNQFIYVNPTKDLVIVKLSAYSDYATVEGEEGYRESETIELFRAIGNAL